MAQNVKDSIRGGMWGLAMGDALGATAEFMSRDDIKEKLGRLVDIQGGGWLQLAPGQGTDDTAMAIATAQGIIEDPQDPVDAVGQRFLEWQETDPPDIGHTVAMALECYRQNPVWEEAGRLVVQALGERACGNGALMRIAPVGLAYWHRSGERDHWAQKLTAMTHASSLCQLLSVAYCSMIAVCVGREAERHEAYHTALHHAQGIMGDVVPKAIVEQLHALEDVTYDELKSTAYVVDTFISACWCFLNNDSAEDAIVAAVNLGGDADTLGAVTGALTGAFYGYSRLPERWREALVDAAILDELSEGLTVVSGQHKG